MLPPKELPQEAKCFNSPELAEQNSDSLKQAMKTQLSVKTLKGQL